MGFLWSTFIYIILLLATILAGIGIFLIYFMFSSGANQSILTGSNLSTSTILVISIIGLFVWFMEAGLNAALASSYKDAINGRKTSLIQFYGNAIKLAGDSFKVDFIKKAILFIIVGIPVIIYFMFLKSYQYVDVLVLLHSLLWIFLINMLFAPAITYVGAYNLSVMPALKRGMNFIQRKHINFIALYFLFAVLWVLNFVPLVGLASVFLGFPILYGAVVASLEA